MTSKQAEDKAREIIDACQRTKHVGGHLQISMVDENKCVTAITTALTEAHAAGRREAIAEVMPTFDEMQAIIKDAEMSPIGVYLYLKSLIAKDKI